MQTPEALLRAATMLKWFRDGAITVDTGPPSGIGEIIVAAGLRSSWSTVGMTGPM